MLTDNLLSKSIYSRLCEEELLPNQVISITYELFILKFKLGQPAKFLDQNLTEMYLNRLEATGNDGLLNEQVEYAIRIADSEGELEYEEMHKLFSLCEEIHALEYLGLEFGNKLKAQYQQSVRQRFEREKRKAKLVAEDKAEKWKEEFWCYKINLGA